MPNVQRLNTPIVPPLAATPVAGPLAPQTPVSPLAAAESLPYESPDSARLGSARGQALPSVSLDQDPPTWSAATKAQIRRGFQQGLQQYGISPQELGQVLKRYGISSLDITEETIQNPAYADEFDRIQQELDRRLNHPTLRSLGQGRAVSSDGQFGKGSVQAVAALRDALRGEPIELKVTPIEQQTRTGCYRTVEAMLYNVLHQKDGSPEAYTEFDTRDRIRDQDMANDQVYVASSENASGRVSVQRDRSMLMLDTVDEELEAGRPVIAGVSYRKQNGKEYNEGITDHFVLISGRGYDEAGTYYTFQDPANGKTHQLRLDPSTGRLSGKGDMVGTYDVTLVQKATSTESATLERYQKMGKVLFSQGERSAGIQDLQMMLTAMGYDTKGTTGAYGNGTATAVGNFQQAHNLPQNGGSVDTHTQASIKSTFQEHMQANPNQVMFRRNQNTPQIGELQKILTRLGHSTNGTNGAFGPGTERAVKAFQTAQGIPPSGHIDNRTWLALLAAAES
ncbi:MAG: hypothetical protein CVV27_11975 [Candidatus Melainabacteria bacterium HGW-Melainabacteria-1]|nr:MAG: hypothetical protein CVV27_11975 [Candidatus Melainabacteria bacterium HGW-Melainabacteria-1]